MQKQKWIPNIVARIELFTLWHVDPETDGTDDSCGWFKRAKHGNPEVLRRIVKRFEEDWDRTWTYDPKEDGGGDEGDTEKRTYMRGIFNPNGIPRFSSTGVALNLFFIAAMEHFKCDGRTNWRAAKQFMRREMFDILLFAENPTDSLYDSLYLTFGKDSIRKERIENMAHIVYGWILRAEQPWYRHARWHVHHWKFQIHAWQKLKRWIFERCCKCGGRFKWSESVVGNWDGDKIWHHQCDQSHVKPYEN